MPHANEGNKRDDNSSTSTGESDDEDQDDNESKGKKAPESADEKIDTYAYTPLYTSAANSGVRISDSLNHTTSALPIMKGSIAAVATDELVADHDEHQSNVLTHEQYINGPEAPPHDMKDDHKRIIHDQHAQHHTAHGESLLLPESDMNPLSYSTLR